MFEFSISHKKCLLLGNYTPPSQSELSFMKNRTCIAKFEKLNLNAKFFILKQSKSIEWFLYDGKFGV